MVRSINRYWPLNWKRWFGSGSFEYRAPYSVIIILKGKEFISSVTNKFLLWPVRCSGPLDHLKIVIDIRSRAKTFRVTHLIIAQISSLTYLGKNPKHLYFDYCNITIETTFDITYSSINRVEIKQRRPNIYPRPYIQESRVCLWALITDHFSLSTIFNCSDKTVLCCKVGIQRAKENNYSEAK